MNRDTNTIQQANKQTSTIKSGGVIGMAQWKHWQSERHGGGGGGLHAQRASGPYTTGLTCGQSIMEVRVKRAKEYQEA